tara:strand:- start:404 stop:937 length:534 start_codon:yes stop_codon:yes gene_type:complete
MALTKVLTGGIALDAVDNTILKLDDDYALTGTVTGTVAGTAAFAARFASTGWVAPAADTIVPFDNDSTGDSFDTDGVFNTSTYKFTAPATGVYMFWFSIYTAQNDASNGFTFLKNSSKLDLQLDGAKFATYKDNAVDETLTFTCVLPLASGNTMAVISATQSDYYKGHCQWGGCRLA